MSAFGGLILTNRGRALQAKAQTGIQLQFTRIGIGDGNLGGASIPDLNTLISEKKSLTINKLKTQTGGKAVVGTVLSNQDITVGFYFRELGVFAQDPDLGEILYCYGNAGANAEYIPAGGGADIIEKNIDIITLIGNASNVSAVIDESLVFETPAGAQEKADAAEANAKAYTDQHEQKLAPHTGHETPTGAQIKADTAENNAKSFASNLIGVLSSLLTTAKNNIVAAINEIKNSLDAHQADDMPHKFIDITSGKTYKYGLKQQDNHAVFVYQEVV
jgi:hypothetical protein